MSVIGEVVGIVSCVTAVVSAYKDGAQIVQKIKDKRRRSEADPPPKFLELSLSQSAVAVEQTYQAGVDRFGTAFRDGDGKARLNSNLCSTLTGFIQTLPLMPYEISLYSYSRAYYEN